MRLTELSPQFLKVEDERTWQHVDALAEADGIIFLCPACFLINGGSRSTHSIICWRPRVPQTVHPVPGRWEFKGTGYADLTLVAGSSSVLLKTAECQAHFNVASGGIVGLTYKKPEEGR